MEAPTTNTKGARSVAEFAEWLGISPIAVRRVIKSGRLIAVRMGRRVLIPEESGQEFLRSLPRAS